MLEELESLYGLNSAWQVLDAADDTAVYLDCQGLGSNKARAASLAWIGFFPSASQSVGIVDGHGSNPGTDGAPLPPPAMAPKRTKSRNTEDSSIPRAD
jgi:hypothetical protein